MKINIYNKKVVLKIKTTLILVNYYLLKTNIKNAVEIGFCVGGFFVVLKI